MGKRKRLFPRGSRERSAALLCSPSNDTEWRGKEREEKNEGFSDERARKKRGRVEIGKGGETRKMWADKSGI